MEAMQADVDAIIAATPWVGMWLNFMMIALVLSLLFVWKHKPARWVALSMVVIVPTAIFIHGLTGNVNLVGISHLIWWIPLLWQVIQPELKNPGFNKKSPYGIWLQVVTLTILASLAFDVYDVLMVIMGVK